MYWPTAERPAPSFAKLSRQRKRSVYVVIQSIAKLKGRKLISEGAPPQTHRWAPSLPLGTEGATLPSPLRPRDLSGSRRPSREGARKPRVMLRDEATRRPSTAAHAHRVGSYHQAIVEGDLRERPSASGLQFNDPANRRSHENPVCMAARKSQTIPGVRKQLSARSLMPRRLAASAAWT